MEKGISRCEQCGESLASEKERREHSCAVRLERNESEAGESTEAGDEETAA